MAYSSPSAFGVLHAAYYGTTVDAFFLGLLTYQVLQYTWDFPKDRLLMKMWVWGLFALEIATTVLQQRIGSHRFMENSPPERGLLYYWEDAARFILLGFISFMTQTFLSYQVYVMTSRRLSILFPLLILTFIVTALSTVSGIMLVSVTEETIHGVLALMLLTLAVLALILDFVIAGILCFVLWKNQIGNRYSDQLLRKVMVGVVQTSSLTAFFAFMDILFFMIFPNNQSHVLWNAALGKVYAISVLSRLNGRTKLKGVSRATTLTNSQGEHGFPTSPKSPTYPYNSHYQNQTGSPQFPRKNSSGGSSTGGVTVIASVSQDGRFGHANHKNFAPSGTETSHELDTISVSSPNTPLIAHNPATPWTSEQQLLTPPLPSATPSVQRLNKETSGWI